MGQGVHGSPPKVAVLGFGILAKDAILPRARAWQQSALRATFRESLIFLRDDG
jgi:hypothetical protein